MYITITLKGAQFGKKLGKIMNLIYALKIISFLNNDVTIKYYKRDLHSTI